MGTIYYAVLEIPRRYALCYMNSRAGRPRPYGYTIYYTVSISLRNFVAHHSIIILYRYAKSQIEAI
jgi:hypothetical protein